MKIELSMIANEQKYYNDTD